MGSTSGRSLVLTKHVRRPHTHLQDVKLAVLRLEVPRGDVGREALAVRAQPVHVSMENITPKFPDRVVH